MSKAETNSEKIIPRNPVDRVARRVTGPAKLQKIQRKPSNEPLWDAPPPTRSLNRSINEDLTGRKFGQFLVIGLLKGGWLVRCSCGRYTRRTAKAIKNPNNDGDCCEECRHLCYLRRRHEYQQHGENKSEDLRDYQ